MRLHLSVMLAQPKKESITLLYFVEDLLAYREIHRIYHCLHQRPKGTKIAPCSLTKCNSFGTTPGLTRRRSNQAMALSSKPS